MLAQLGCWLRRLLPRIAPTPFATVGRSPSPVSDAASRSNVTPTLRLLSFPRRQAPHASLVLRRDRRLDGNHASELSPTLPAIAEAWPTLPPDIREAILTLVDAAQRSSERTS